MTSMIVALNMVFTVGISCLIHCSFLIAFFPLVIVFISFSPSSFLFFSSVFFCILHPLLRRILLIVIMPAITRPEVINNHHRNGHPCGFDLHQFYPQSSPSSSVWLRLPGVNFSYITYSSLCLWSASSYLPSFFHAISSWSASSSWSFLMHLVAY